MVHKIGVEPLDTLANVGYTVSISREQPAPTKETTDYERDWSQEAGRKEAGAMMYFGGYTEVRTPQGDVEHRAVLIHARSLAAAEAAAIENCKADRPATQGYYNHTVYLVQQKEQP